MRNKVLRAAQTLKEMSMDEVADAKKSRVIKLEGTIDIQLIEEEDYGLLKMAGKRTNAMK